MENVQALREIFEKSLKQTKAIWKSREVFLPTYIPPVILHREKQMCQLAQILSPVLKNSKASNIFVYGKPGTGKTLVVKYVLNELEAVAKNTTNLKIIFVNCRMKRLADTEYRLLRDLCGKLGKSFPPTGLPTYELYQTFITLLEEKATNFIIILDEIDFLLKKIGDDFLYNFLRMPENLAKSRITLIGITNDLNLIEKLDPRVKSSLSQEEIFFPPYNAKELQDILQERAREAFYEDVLTPKIIPKCAGLAAQEHGDARRALDLLRIAAELAEREGSEKVKEEHVDLAQERLEKEKVIEAVKVLPTHSKILLLTLLEFNQPVATGELYLSYEKNCFRFGFKSLTQRRVSTLLSELDSLGIINSNLISKGRYGRTRLITLSLSEPIKKEVEKSLKEEFF